MQKKSFPKNTYRSTRGFILPFTMLISTLVLFITAGSMALLSKQLYFSKIYKQSQTAYYAADDAVACTLAIDDTYLASDGLGIFVSSTTYATGDSGYLGDVITYVNLQRSIDGLPAITLNSISCGQSAIFDQALTGYAVSATDYQYNSPTNGIELGKTTTFNMRMNLGNNTYRCAKVTVNKTESFRQIIAQGYSHCDNISSAIERAVVNTTVVE